MIERRKNSVFIYRILIVFIVLIGMVLVPYSICEAASASITLDSDKTTFTTGDEIAVSIQLSSEALLGDFEAYVTYNDDVLEFKSGASFIAGGDGLLKITDMTATGEEYTRKYIINFTAKKVGNSQIAMKDKPEIYEYETGLDMSVSANQLNISVAAPKSASTNTNLKSLKINPGTLTPEFDKDVSNYEAQVTAEADKIIVSAITEDDTASVTVKGNDKLEAGNNRTTITVKSESGHTKTYSIDVIRKEEKTKDTTEETAEETMEQETDTKEDYSLENKTTKINNILAITEDDKIYIQNGYRYQIIPISDESKIPSGYVKTTLILNEVIIDAYTPESNLESDFLLLYAMNEEGEQGFYQYDRVEKTMQRYTLKQEEIGNKYIMTDEILHSEEYKNRITTMGIIIAILGAILITMSIALIHVVMKAKEPKE